MPSNNDETGKQQWERIVREYALKAYEAQERWSEEGTEGYTSPDTHKQLAKAAVSYHRVLKEYQGESVVKDDEFPDISWLEERLGETIQRTSPAPGRSRTATVEKVPAVTEIPVEKIMETIDELHSFREKLGMKGGVKSRPEHNDVSHDDLHGLLKRRGQEDAAQRVPGGGDD